MEQLPSSAADPYLRQFQFADNSLFPLIPPEKKKIVFLNLDESSSIVSSLSLKLHSVWVNRKIISLLLSFVQASDICMFACPWVQDSLVENC
ncbi:hypothetical protein LguiA_028829 [Lonicera macranthoides]